MRILSVATAAGVKAAAILVNDHICGRDPRHPPWMVCSAGPAKALKGRAGPFDGYPGVSAVLAGRCGPATPSSASRARNRSRAARASHA